MSRITKEQKLRKAVEVLKRHNLWLRATSVKSMHSEVTPTVLGFSIDTVVEYLEQDIDCDGIEARNATINLLERRIENYRDQVKDLHAVMIDINEELSRINKELNKKRIIL